MAPADRFTDLRRRIERLRVKRDDAVEGAERLVAEVETLRQKAQDHAEALPITLAIARSYRQSKFDDIEGLVAKSLRTVFSQEFGFVLEQQEKRNQVETVPLVIDRDGHRVRPVDGMGGGVVDVTSLTLRAILWSQQADRSDPTLLLDEPAHKVNGKAAIKRISEVMQGLSSALGLQFIVATNRPGLSSAADRTFKLENESGHETTVEVVEEAESYGQI